MCSMVIISLNIFCRRDNSCMEDSFRWCGINFLSYCTRFTASAMIVSSGVTVGFVMYLCLKILSLKLLLHVAHVPISSNIVSVNNICQYILFFSVLCECFLTCRFFMVKSSIAMVTNVSAIYSWGPYRCP